MSDNPFADLVRPGPKQSEVPANPFADLIGGGRRMLVPHQVDRSAGEAFLSGVKGGFLLPTNIITGKDALEQDIELDTPVEHVANILGAFVGFGIGWVPIARGTGFALKGIGLTRVLGEGTAFRAVTNTIATGLFEASAQTELEDTPTAFLRGAAFGAAIEGLLLAGAMRNRSRLPTTLEGATSDGTKVAINADALAIEQALDIEGSRTLDELTTKLADIGPAESQLDDVLGRVTALYRPGGFAIIPQVRSPKDIIASLKRINPDIETVVARVDKEFSEVMLFDPSVDARMVRVARKAAKRGVTLGKYLGTGAKMSSDDAIALIKQDFPGEFWPPLTDVKRGKFGDLLEAGDPVTTIVGADTRGVFADFGDGTAAIRLFDPGPGRDLDQLGVLVHEYTHYITMSRGQHRQANLLEVFNLRTRRVTAKGDNIYTPDDVFMDMITQGGHAFPLSTLDPHNLPSLIKEFKAASFEILKIDNPQLNPGTLLDKLNEGWFRYYGKDTELMARVVQLMLLDPRKAKEVAPRATRLMSRLISRESPKLKMMLTEHVELQALDDLLNLRWRQEIDGKRMFFRENPFKLNPKKAAREFQSNGFVSGMTVEYRGRLYEATGGSWREIDGQIRLFDPETKNVFAVSKDEVVRPLLPNMVQATESVTRRLTELMTRQANWFGFAIETKDGIRRGIVNTEEYASARSFVDYFRRNSAEILQGRRYSEITNLRGEVIEHLKKNNLKGIVLEEQGIPIEVYPIDQTTVQLGQSLSHNYGLPVDAANVVDSSAGLVIESFVPSFRNRVESLLRDSGVDGREIDFWMPHAERVFAKQAEGVMEDEFRTIVRKARESKTAQLSFGSNPTEPEILASHNGLQVDRTVNGKIRVLAPDGLELGRFLKEADANRFISRVGRPQAPDLDASTAITSSSMSHGGAGSGMPPPPQSALTTTSKASAKSWQEKFDATFNNLALALARVTPIQSVAQAIENLGLGKAWTSVYRPTQLALREIDRLLGGLPRPKLNGETLKGAAEKLSKRLTKLPTERRYLITRSIEALSKEEVAQAGGVLAREMTPAEIKLADDIERLGLADDIPDILGRAARVEIGVREAVKNASKNLGLKGEGLKAYESATRRTLIDAQQLTPERRWVFDQLLGLDDSMSALAIARYAAAPALKPGFKTGREMFLAENGFNGLERKAAMDLDGIFEEVFFESGFNKQQMVAGFWPIARKFLQKGFVVGGEEGSLSAKLFGHTPEGTRWIGRRLRSGGLDPYELDPGLYAYQQARNMLMNQHFDPLLPAVTREIESIAVLDQRAGKIMTEYLNELIGVKHEQFKKLQEYVRRVGLAFGQEVPEETAEKFVNTMVKLAHQAAIPWRFALVLRNYMQTVQMTVPIVGPEAWLAGLKTAMTDEGFRQAVRAGAVDVNVIPVFASTEVLGTNTFRISERLADTRFAEKVGPLLRQAGSGWETLMTAGFDFYRHADDVGRAIAYHAGRHRVNKFMGAFKAESTKGDRVVALERLKERAKVKTFNETIEKEFDRFMLDGNFEQAADLIGVSLADKAHFLYGHANHPSGWGGVYGRVFGQFGTFPSQYVQLLLEGARRGSAKDRAEFFAGHIGINAAIVGAGAELFGLDLGSWSTIPSLHYTGGPYADMAINLVNFWSGTEQERSVAAQNLKYMRPTFDSPQSIFLPGSYFLGDLADAIEAPAGRGLGEAMGFRFLRPNEDNWLQKALGWAY